jgi:hypothetical protein
MAIKFLTDHTVDGPPKEEFKSGQVVKDRSEASEMHFVRRGVAAFVGARGELTDHEGRGVGEPVTAIVVDVHNNRDGEVGRAGEVALEDGTPQRGSSGPGEVAMTSAVTEGETTRRRGK